MGYVFTPEHRRNLSESLKGVRNAVGPHQMTPEGRSSLRLAQLKRWLLFYEAKEDTQKVWETTQKIEKEERRRIQYGW